MRCKFVILIKYIEMFIVTSKVLSLCLICHCKNDPWGGERLKLRVCGQGAANWSFSELQNCAKSLNTRSLLIICLEILYMHMT